MNTFRMDGIEQLKRTLRAIGAALMAKDGNAEVREAMLQPMLRVRDEAKSMAPVRTGTLRNAIKAAPAKELPAAYAWVSRSEAPYANVVERGSSRMPAQPFFRPAVASVRQGAAGMMAPGVKNVVIGAARANRWTAPG